MLAVGPRKILSSSSRLVEGGANIRSRRKVAGLATCMGSFVVRTIHELLLFHVKRKTWLISLMMKCDDMKPSTALVTFYSDRPFLVLHRKVCSDGTRAVADKVEGLMEPLTRLQIMK